MYVTSAIASTESLTVIPNDYRSAVTVLSTVTLRFKYNVDINIWAHDVFVLYVPEK